MAVQFEGGVVVGADSRTTTGSYIVRLPKPYSLSSQQLTIRPQTSPTTRQTNRPTSMTAYTAVDLAQRQIHKPSQTWCTWRCSNLRTSLPFHTPQNLRIEYLYRQASVRY